jgi:hypothetical protein
MIADGQADAILGEEGRSDVQAPPGQVRYFFTAQADRLSLGDV